MIKTEILKQLNQEFSNNKMLVELQAQQNLYKALNNQDFAYLDSQVNALTIEIAKAEFDNNLTQAKQLKERKKQLQSQQQEILSTMNLSLKDLSPKYACFKCQDTGFIKGTPCECFKVALSNKLLQQSNIKLENLANFEKSNFNLFDIQYKEEMLKIYKIMQDFCSRFPNLNKKNIILSGGTGTGKTFLLECVSAELIRKGHYVYYITAFNLSNQLLQYHMSNVADKNAIINPLLECDCLIIDDLGAEPIRKNITIEYLLTIISERTINGKSTLISTNLAPQDIMDKYGERIYSRLMDKSNCVLIKFNGNDLRVKRN